jgi:hypothetical protein
MKILINTKHFVQTDLVKKMHIKCFKSLRNKLGVAFLNTCVIFSTEMKMIRPSKKNWKSHTPTTFKCHSCVIQAWSNRHTQHYWPFHPNQKWTKNSKRNIFQQLNHLQFNCCTTKNDIHVCMYLFKIQTEKKITFMQVHTI